MAGGCSWSRRRHLRHERNGETMTMAPDAHRLVEIRQSHDNGAAGASSTDHQNTDGAVLQNQPKSEAVPALTLVGKDQRAVGEFKQVRITRKVGLRARGDGFVDRLSKLGVLALRKGKHKVGVLLGQCRGDLNLAAVVDVIAHIGSLFELVRRD